MNRNLSIALVSLMAVALGLWLAQGCADRDERLIRKALEELREAGEMSQTENTFTAAASARRIGAYFTDDVQANYRRLPMPITNRRQLEQVAFQVRSRMESIDIRIRGGELDLERGETNAVMRLAAQIALRGGGGSEASWEEVELTWNKHDGQWKIANVRPLETIRTP